MLVMGRTCCAEEAHCDVNWERCGGHPLTGTPKATVRASLQPQGCVRVPVLAATLEMQRWIYGELKMARVETWL